MRISFSSKFSKLLAVVAIGAVAAGSAAFAKADHGGDNGNRGRGHGNGQTVAQNIAQNSRHDGDDEANEQELEHMNQVNNAKVVVNVKFRISRNLLAQVSSVSGTTITAKDGNGLNVSINAANAKLMARRGNTTITMADIQANDVLQVTGDPSTDGSTFVATLVRDLSLKGTRNIVPVGSTFTGTISGLSTNSFVIGTQVILTNASTTFTKNGTAATFADLANGQQATATGAFDATHTNFTATSVAVTVPTNVTIVGSLTGVSGTTLTVTSNSIVFTVNAASAVVTRTGVAGNVALTTLSNGDTLSVTGSQAFGTNNITATTINDQNLLTVTINGTLNSVSGNTLSVTSGTTTYTVDATSAAVTRTGVTGSVALSTLVAGNTLQITGSQTSPTAITATAVLDQTAI